MNRKVLLIFAALLTLTGVGVLIIGKHYAFIHRVFDTWMFTIFFGIILLLTFALSSKKNIARLPRALILLFPIVLVVLWWLVLRNIPTYSYQEAKDKVALETKEEIIVPEQQVVQAQDGMYFIYTKKHVYIFSADSGLYFEGQLAEKAN